MINALDQTGLAYFWSKITGRLATKADLVNGKVPASQLPASGGGGVTSWNDLEDKPFGETHYQAATYTMPDMATTAYSAATFHTDDYDIALKLYRVGDALPHGALIGGNVSYISPLESGTATIINDNIRSSTDGVAYVVKPSNVDFPAVCVCFADGETVEIDLNDGISFLGTIAQAGTYLIWGDLSIVSAGASYYTSELNTVDYTDIKQLDPKFYIQPAVLQCTVDFADATETAGGMQFDTTLTSGTYAAALAAAQAGTPAVLKITLQNTVEGTTETVGAVDVFLQSIEGDHLSGGLSIGGDTVTAMVASDGSIRVVISNAGGESDVVWVNGLLNLQTMSIASLDKTYQQVSDAVASGKDVKLKIQFYITQSVYEYGVGNLSIIPDTSASSPNPFEWGLLLYGNFGTGLEMHYFNVWLQNDEIVGVAYRMVTSSGT